jgi:hypothetical protein
LIISVNLHNLPLQEEKDFNESSVFQHPNNHSCYCFQTINYVSALHQTIDLAISIKNCLSGFQQMDCIFIHLLLSIHYKTEVTSMKLISLQTGARHLISKKQKMSWLLNPKNVKMERKCRLRMASTCCKNIPFFFCHPEAGLQSLVQSPHHQQLLDRWAAVHLHHQTKNQIQNLKSTSKMKQKCHKAIKQHFYLASQEKVPSMKFTDPSSK